MGRTPPAQRDPSEANRRSHVRPDEGQWPTLPIGIRSISTELWEARIDPGEATDELVRLLRANAG